MTIDAEIVKQDAEQLERDYTRTWSDLDKTWRQLSLESHPGRRAFLESKAEALTYAARDLATVHERAIKTLEKLEVGT